MKPADVARNGGGSGDRVHRLAPPVIALGLVQVGVWSSYMLDHARSVAVR